VSEQRRKFDVIIIGSGAAGLSVALQLADHLDVAVISNAALSEGATMYAQGGVSAVLDAEDGVDSHVADTLEAGAGLCNEQAVRFIVERGRERIEWLINQGVPFTKNSSSHGGSEYHLTREGGHSHRRMIHAADATGRAIETRLGTQARQHPRITVYERHFAVDLITAKKVGLNRQRYLGAYSYDRDAEQVITFAGKFVVLATGWAGKVYLYTSNPDVSTGDGIAMAWRAGCRIANMEFIQFHPTCLYQPAAKSFLITEAIRGEGGRRRLETGEAFMPRFDPRAELAPRDIVARAIDHEMKRLGVDCVYLDISHRSVKFIVEHFPTVSARCREYGFDLASEPIPVVPAAYYTCGGVLTDTHGHSSLPGLFALGEVSCTGLHHANRLASNSLLECIVVGEATATTILAAIDNAAAPPELPLWDESQVTDSDEEVVVSHNWDELRRLMWDYVGIVRTTKRLQRARHSVDLLHTEIAEYYENFRITTDLRELRNLVEVADLIIRSAMQRQERRGLHYTLDFPDLAENIENTVLERS